MSPRFEDQQQLRDALASGATLDRLDSPDERDRLRPQDLQLARVLGHLRPTNSQAAVTLAQLVQVPDFIRDQTRLDLLVRAHGSPGELLPDSLRFLQAQSRPGAVEVEVVVEALCRNGSAAAFEVMGRILKDGGHPLATRLEWIHRHLLVVRRKVEFLEKLESWLFDSEFQPEIRAAMAETVFEYRPAEWFRSTEIIPRPPSDEGLPEAARAALQRIGLKVVAGDFKAEVQAAARLVSGIPNGVSPAK